MKLLIGLLLALLIMASHGQAREITDMSGRSVLVPDHITRVYAAQPYTLVLMAVVAPDLLVGLPGPLSEGDRRFVGPEMVALPVFGSGMGPGAKPDMAAVLALHPDIVLLKGGPRTDTARAVKRFAGTGLPVVFVDIDRIEDYAAGIEFTGALLERGDRAGKLAAYARRILTEIDRAISAVPAAQRVSVYYAESADGLATECDQSFHADAIRLAGGDIVHHCTLSRHIGMEPVSLAQVLEYNPQFIVAADPAFAASVRTDERWQGVRAVAEKKVLSIPRSPFNWIDRPPSVMRLMGVQWLAHCFYPERYPLDLREATREFQQLFFGVTPNRCRCRSTVKGFTA
ncbi:MAG: ABC transporter substrate-binding protein [Proteobacteria bacterium]|nr:ABC transporter substrate-binding protein [Pseudomonadota bacterium]MBU4295954.1 ABC transporter substrate-binding protein [Pseudomonadota bacterium]MCG2746164.1 ABC transporter substrate-binding protein [Desulfobulbaceae bacterium]